MIDYREISLMSQGRSNQEEVITTYVVSGWIAVLRLFMNIDGHTSPLDPMAGFEKIMKHKSQWDNLDRS